MEGKTISSERIEMEKPYLSIPGIDYFGHARHHSAMPPLEPHSHPHCMEIVFVMDGQQIYYADGKRYDVVGGEGFISFLDQEHRSDNDGQGVGEIYWMQLNLTHTEDFLGLNRELSVDLVEGLRGIDQHFFRFDAFMRSLVKRVFDEFYRQGTSPLAIASLGHLLQLFLRTIKKERTVQNRFSGLEQYIEAHLTEHIGIEDLSEQCQLSVSTLQHAFKNYFGRTPAEYINYRKIQKAKELLLEGKSVMETAMLLDFNTSDYFSTVFRKFTHSSPSQWLAKNRKA